MCHPSIVSLAIRTAAKNRKRKLLLSARRRKTPSVRAHCKCPVLAPSRAAPSAVRCCKISPNPPDNAPSAVLNSIPANSAPTSIPPAVLSARNPFPSALPAKTHATNACSTPYASWSKRKLPPPAPSVPTTPGGRLKIYLRSRCSVENPGPWRWEMPRNSSGA